MMHTDPKDQNGQDLEHILNELKLTDGQVVLSTERLDQKHLGSLYNAVDCTVNISDAEGFGLATLESMACGTPIIVNMTGGLQEQVTNGDEWFGLGLEPCSKAIIGSQQVPYIYEDRLNKEQFLDAIEQMYYSWHDKSEIYERWVEKGQKHVKDNYNFEAFCERWVEAISHIHEKYGSWETRKGYKSWELMEIT
jgi:glycosyltransferase involved in cell wall biosynthesis